jgi:hypothetical protein
VMERLAMCTGHSFDPPEPWRLIVVEA